MEKLKEQYLNEVVPALMKKFEYKSVMQVPKLEKIVINIGLGDVKDNPKSLENAMNDLSIITGQKPVITKAKKSIAAFKLREGAKIGCKVTLRSGKMYDFVYKLLVFFVKKPLQSWRECAIMIPLKPCVPAWKILKGVFST